MNTRSKRIVTRLFGPVFAIAVGCSGAAAQDTQDMAAALAEARARLDALQETVDKLERQLAQSAPLRADVAPQPEVTELAERVEDLEAVTAEVDAAIGSRAVVNAFDGVRLDVGGFFDSAASIVIGDEGTDASFNRQVFELLVKAELGPRWDLFVAQAFVREAPLTFTDPQQRTRPSFGDNNAPVATDTVIAWGQYHHSDLLNVQFGRFISPLGIINVEHFPASLLDTEQPQFLRPFPGQTLFANFANGLNVYGTTFFGDSALNYAAFAGVWAGNSTNATFGGRLGYKIANTGFTVGANGFSGDRSGDASGDRFYGGGVDILYDKGPLQWKSEFFATSEGGGGDRLAYYTEPAIRLSDRWTAFYRYDFFDNGAAGGESVEHLGGIVFDPIDNVRLRALYRKRRLKEGDGFDSADIDIIQFATTLNF